MGDCVESLAEVKVDNIHGSPFVYPASHVIIESYQIGQVFLLSTNTSKFCHSYMPGRLFRNNFEEPLHYSMSLKGTTFYTISDLFRLCSLMTGTSRRNTCFL